jgi:transaldolase
VTDLSLHLYIDSADVGDLAGILPHPLVYGVTTNPTLLRRAGVSADRMPALLEQLRAWGARAVHVQVGSADVDGMLRDAEQAVALAEPGLVVVKIPATREGFAAGSWLSASGVPVTYTAIYEPEQATFAAMTGAAYAAPYLGRLTDQGREALATIARMHALVDRYGTGTRLLVASVRSRRDFLSLLDIGVGAITVPPSLVPALLDHAGTQDAERVFLDDARAMR